jgi:hypothetical protein
MSFQRRVGETRRSTRVPLTVLIAAQVTSGPVAFGGETIVVNRHGALIFCTAPLRAGLEIEISVIITDKRATAKVVYVDPKRPQVCGIELAKPENIWGVSFPPDDWYEDADESES